MFHLTTEELAGRNILDCPGGACSFSSQARKHRAHAVAADIVYQHRMNDLETKGLRDIEHTMEQMRAVQGSMYGISLERLKG